MLQKTMILYLSITVKNLFPFSIRDPTLSMLERGGEEGGVVGGFFSGSYNGLETY